MNAGKGDSPRPVNLAIYRGNYDAIFRKGKPVLVDKYHPDTVKLRDHSKHSKKRKSDEKRIFKHSSDRQADVSLPSTTQGKAGCNEVRFIHVPSKAGNDAAHRELRTTAEDTEVARVGENA